MTLARADGTSRSRCAGWRRGSADNSRVSSHVEGSQDSSPCITNVHRPAAHEDVRERHSLCLASRLRVADAIPDVERFSHADETPNDPRAVAGAYRVACGEPFDHMRA